MQLVLGLVFLQELGTLFCGQRQMEAIQLRQQSGHLVGAGWDAQQTAGQFLS